MFDAAEMHDGGDGDRLARSVAALDPVCLAVVADLAETLAGDPRSRTAGELTDQMRSLDRLHAVIDSATLGTWSAWEDTMAYTDDGYAAPGSWINANLCVRGGVARYQVGLARKLGSGFPHINAAAAAGRLGRAKVELLVKARAEDIADVFDNEEEQLVEEVASRTVEAADMYLAAWRLEVLERLRQNDKDTPPPPEPVDSELQLSPILDDRMMFRGELSPADAALMSKAIDDRIDQWFTAGLLTNDTRSRRQLQAAALIELVRDGTAPANRGNGARPLTLALIDADTLTARAAAHYQAWLDHFMSSAGIGWPGAGPPSDPRSGPSAASSAASSRRTSRRNRDRGSSGPGRRNRPDAPPPGPPGQPFTPDLFGAGEPGSDRGSSDPPSSDPPSPDSPSPGWPGFSDPSYADQRDPGWPGAGCSEPPGPVPGCSDPSCTGPQHRENSDGARTGRDQSADEPFGASPPAAGRSGDGPGSVESTLDDIRDHLADLTRFAATSPTTQQMTFRSELIGAGTVDPSLIEELICSGDLVPILHRNHTEILNMGRAVRLATPAQRKALLVRSGGTCEWPGCSIPHGWCDAHHLHYWEHQGPTDLDNLALVCNHHHKQFHRDGYTGLVTTTGLEVLRPDGTPIQPTLSGRW